MFLLYFYLIGLHRSNKKIRSDINQKQAIFWILCEFLDFILKKQNVNVYDLTDSVGLFVVGSPAHFHNSPVNN